MRRFERLDIAEGLVKIGGDTLPGVFSRLSVDGEVEFDEIETKGHSAPKRQHNGFKDQGIVLEMVLVDGGGLSPVAKLALVYELFTAMDAGAAPVIYDITHPHLAARKITRVLFKSVKSVEDSRRDSIIVTVNFVEYAPPVVVTEKRKQEESSVAASSSGGSGSGSDGGGESPPLMAGLKDGLS